MPKKINSHSYWSVKPHILKPSERLANGFLYSNKPTGLYATKIKPEDLPESFIRYTVHGEDRYIDAANVTGLCYKSNYIFNHIFKDDALYISYSGPIAVRDEDPSKHIELFSERVSPCDYTLWGHILPEFVKAVSKYSGLDTSQILDEMNKKVKWFEDADGNPDANFEKHKKFYIANI